jgi:hypothetical protein
MRWLLTLAVCGCVGVALATPAARAQQDRQRDHHAGRSAGSNAPQAAQFVSTPGQMVSTPGQGVTTPGQSVTMPGVMVTTPGQSIAPTPGVIAPFHTQQQPTLGQTQQSSQAGRQGVSAGRHHHNRHEYRPEYGAVMGYAVPYVVENGSGTAATNAGGSGGGTGWAPRTAVRANPERTAYNSGLPLADAPSGNRPAYRPEAGSQPETPSSAPNVIQSREPVLTIVMKNGTKRRMRNYALTPKTLMDLDGAASGTVVKIPLSEVNLAATEKAAAQAGLSFAVPKS